MRAEGELHMPGDDGALGLPRVRQDDGPHAQVGADSAAQAGARDGTDDAGRDAPPAAVPVEVPRKRKVPTGEGYCSRCHFIVGTWRRRLIQHAGHYALYIGGAAPKSPEDEGRSTKHVKWCEGSGKLPSPDPENMINPWDPFVKRSP